MAAMLACQCSLPKASLQASKSETAVGLPVCMTKQSPGFYSLPSPLALLEFLYSRIVNVQDPEFGASLQQLSLDLRLCGHRQ